VIPPLSRYSSDWLARSTRWARSSHPWRSLVDLHFSCGFSLEEIADFRSVSVRTIQRDWRKARLLLHRTVEDV
jgi:hypothetical protein